jgi:uncharacterized protein (DUF924 family)
MAIQSEILTIWYGEHEPLDRVGFANQAIWYKKDPEFDAMLKERFEAHINRVTTTHGLRSPKVTESQSSFASPSRSVLKEHVQRHPSDVCV